MIWSAETLFPQASITVHVRVMMFWSMQLEAPFAVMEAVPPFTMDSMLPATSLQLITISSLLKDRSKSAPEASARSWSALRVAPTMPAPAMLLMRTST